MPRRQFKVPFAATGDTVSIPDTTQPDGSVSMQQGFGFDYQRDPNTDPLAKVFPRDVHNGLLNEITASLGEIQQQGYPIWVASGAPYPINAVVRHNNSNWQSNIATNNDEPGVGAGATSWKVAGAQIEKFNAPIVTIPSAATVDLTALAPNTSQITISGSVAITGFTVEAARAFVVKFSGACTLTNNASIVTGTGANIVTAPGDSCILRATAENTVEVILKNLLADRGLGSGQTLQNMTGSRLLGTTYTNTTGRTIQVIINASGTNSARCSVLVNSVAVIQSSSTEVGGNTENVSCSIPIPSGATYSFQVDLGGSLSSIWELR